MFNKGIVDEYFISNFHFLSHTLSSPRSFLSLTDSSILSYYIFHFHLTLSVRHGMSVISHMHFHHTYSLSSHASHTDSLSSHIISNIIYLLSLLQSHLTHTLITHALYSLSHHIFFIYLPHTYYHNTHSLFTASSPLSSQPLSLSLFRSLSLSLLLSLDSHYGTHTLTLNLHTHSLSSHTLSLSTVISHI